MKLGKGRTAQPPSGLPVLDAGAHLAPEDGSCLMEYVSMLAGEPFSDEPRCTDPTLAALARLVNDAITDEERHRLAAMAPDIAAASPIDPVSGASLVLTTLLRAQTASGPSASLDRHIRSARRRLGQVSAEGVTGRLARWWEPAHRRGSGSRHLAAAVRALGRLPGRQRDEQLYGVLIAALAARARTAPDVEPGDVGGLVTRSDVLIDAAAPGDGPRS